MLLQTKDGGRNWERWSSLKEFGLQALAELSIGRAGSGWAVGLVMPGNKGLILGTSDFGKSWEIQAKSPQELQRLAVLSNNKAAAAGLGGILVTRDGREWHGTYKTDGYVMDIDAVGDHALFAVLERGIVVCSTDVGERWKEIHLQPPYNNLFLGSVKFADPMHGWIGGEDGIILATKDGGETWSLETRIQTDFVRDFEIDNHRLFAVGNNGAIFWRDSI